MILFGHAFYNILLYARTRYLPAVNAFMARILTTMRVRLWLKRKRSKEILLLQCGLASRARSRGRREWPPRSNNDTAAVPKSLAGRGLGLQNKLGDARHVALSFLVNMRRGVGRKINTVVLHRDRRSRSDFQRLELRRFLLGPGLRRRHCGNRRVRLALADAAEGHWAAFRIRGACPVPRSWVASAATARLQLPQFAHP